MGRDLWPITLHWLKAKKAWAVLMFFLVLVLITLVSSACGTLEQHQELDPEVYYMPDIKLEWKSSNGTRRYMGSGVLPVKSLYDFEITAPGDIDFLKISTCHRLHPDQPQYRIFNSKKEYVWRYEPDPLMEMRHSCPLRIEAYEEGVEARHSFGIFEFKTPDETLPATLRCNGVIQNTIGVSMCVTLETLTQRIEFPVEVELPSQQAGCEIPESKDGRVWEFSLPNRECVFAFFEKKGERIHRMFTIGAEAVPIRGE